MTMIFMWRTGSIDSEIGALLNQLQSKNKDKKNQLWNYYVFVIIKYLQLHIRKHVQANLLHAGHGTGVTVFTCNGVWMGEM